MKLVLLVAVLFLATEASVLRDDASHGKAVSGTTPCGIGAGSGVFVEVAVSACTRVPCILYASSTYELALTFKTSVTTGNLYLTLRYRWGSGAETTWFTVFLPGTFTAGLQYRVANPILIPADFRGRSGYFGIVAHVGAAAHWPGQLCRMLDVEIAGARDEAAHNMTSIFKA